MGRRAPNWDPAMIEEIRRGIHVNPRSAEFLHHQINAGLRRWMTSQPVGARVPSEQTLSKLIRVDRRTVARAMRDFVERGILTRNVRGTFLARPLDPADVPAKSGARALEIPPLALQASPPGVMARALKLAVFESLPCQRQVWAALAETFARAHPELELRLLWPGMNVDTPEAYCDYLQTQKPDLALLNHSTALRLKREGALPALPDDLAKELRGPEFLNQVGRLDQEDLLSHAVPLHFSPMAILWNENLTGDLSAGLPAPMTLARALPVIASKEVSLPAGACFNSKMWELLVSTGVPDTGVPRGLTRAYFERLFEILQPLRKHAVECRWHEETPHAGTAVFVNGQAACYIGSLQPVLMFSIAQPTRHWNGTFLLPEPRHRLVTGCCLVAGMGGSRDPGRDQALRFFASPAAQELLAERKMNCVFRTSSNLPLRSWLRGLDLAQLKTAATQLLLNDDAVYHTWVFFMARNLRPLAREVVEGKSPVEAAKEALELVKQCEFGPSAHQSP